ncbi:MaoC/PaaZ C-terminal domain-containing protein [Rhodococcoides yunnanense]|uniref:MaoC/PaaZ C-terminal domain-containing protein n=1 Tax=Rhodococcoides yunnanense TaxID=278209 RepID=UPI000933CCAB|nr:MaoC/PaaZ C-terminal domain-containing protein [Rhodococcus yunnanensis]
MIDPSAAIGAELAAQEFEWTPRDVQTYNLALGAGGEPSNPRELRYLDDTEPVVLPTFATVAPTFHATEAPRVQFPGVDIDLAKVVHGTQQVTVSSPIPPAGRARTITWITDVWDKGNAAVIVQESRTTAPDGTELWRTRSSMFARGEGGFGGERGQTTRVPLPERPADAETTIALLPQQALLYRMCGDRNPLHSDPEFATSAGFSAPIQHGLCTYGMVCKAVTDTMLDGDVESVRSFEARFAGVVYPGESLLCRIWAEDDRLVVGVFVRDRHDAPALADVVLTTR